MSAPDPPRRLPPAQTLHAFDAAARHMSFTGAAHELGVTQAAVSQRIRSLERHLGQALFLRQPQGVALTDAGRALLPAVRDAFARLSSGIHEAFGDAREAPLSIRTTPGFAVHWLAPRLRAFQILHPGVALRLGTAIWPSDFDLAGVDLEVRYGRGDWPGVEAWPLTQGEMAPVCAPAAARGLSAPTDLAGRVLLHAVGFERGWPQWLDLAGAARVAEGSTAMRCDTMAVSLALAEHDAGIALGRRGFIEPLLADGRLVLPFEAPWLSTPEAFYLLRAAGGEPRPAADAFWRWLTTAPP